MTRLLWLLGFAAACAGGSGTPAPPPPAPETLSSLDMERPELVQPIAPGDMEPGVAYKFVQVEVVEVANPAKYALTFELYYQRPGDDRVHLGDFSLYPADNPGRFLVPAQGKVRNEGALVLRMTSPDRIEPGAKVRASVRRMRFLKG